MWGTPTGRCTDSGDIFKECFKVGPFSFWLSKKYDAPLCEECCSTSSGEPRRFYMMLDHHFYKPNTMVYDRTPLWDVYINSTQDPIPNQVMGTTLFDFSLDIPGINEFVDPSPYFAGVQYIDMENVQNNSFQLTIPTYPNFGYITTPTGFMLTPVNNIELVSNDIVVTTDVPHLFNEDTYIDKIECLNADSPFNLDDPSFRVGEILNSTQFTIWTEIVKLFPNYWDFVYEHQYSLSPFYHPNYYSPSRDAFIPYFNNPYFTKQNDAIEASSIYIKEDVDGVPDARLGMVFTTPHGYQTGDMAQLCYGDDLETPYKKVYVERVSDTELLVSEVVVPTTQSIFIRSPRQPFSFTMDAANDHVKMLSYDGTAHHGGYMDDLIAGNRLIFIHQYTDEYIASNRDWYYAYALNMSYQQNSSKRYWYCDVKGVGEPVNDDFFQQTYNTAAYLDYEQFKKNSSLKVVESDGKKFNLATTHLVDYEETTPYWEILPFCFAQIFKTISQEHLYIPKTQNTMVSLTITGSNVARLVSTQSISSLLPPIPLLGQRINLYNLLKGGGSVEIINVVDANTVDVESPLHSWVVGQYIAPGTQILLNESYWMADFADFYIYEFESEAVLDELKKQYYSNPMTFSYYVMDFSGSIRSIFNPRNKFFHEFMIDKMRHNDFPLKLVCPLEGGIDFIDDPLNLTPAISDFTQERFGASSKIGLKRMKRLFTELHNPSVDYQYNVNPAHYVSDQLIKTTYQRSGCTFDEVTNTLTVSMTQNHNLTNGDVVKLNDMVYHTSDFYPREALGRQFQNHRNTILSDYYLQMFKEREPIFGDTPRLDDYEANSTNSYYKQITSKHFVQKLLLDRLENSSHAVNVIDSTTFTITVNLNSINLYQFEQTIPELNTVHIRKNYSSINSISSNPTTTVITYNTSDGDGPTSDGMANGRRYYTRIGADKPTSEVGEGEYASSDLINLSHYRLTTGEVAPITKTTINDGPHRLIMDINYLSDTRVHVRAIIDGNTSQKTQMLVYEDTLDVTTVTPLMLQLANLNPNVTHIQDDVTYAPVKELSSLSKSNPVALYNLCSLGCFAYKFGTRTLALRSDNHLDIVDAVNSWSILKDDKSYISDVVYTLDDSIVPNQTTLTSLNTGDTLKTGVKTMGRLFNRIMLDGTDHVRVRKIEITQETGYANVKCWLGDIYFPSQHSQFWVGDWIELGRAKQKGLNRKWRVQESQPSYIVFKTHLTNLINENCANNVVIIKKIAMRDLGSFMPEVFSWSGVGASSELMTYSRINTANSYSFSVTDTAYDASTLISNPAVGPNVWLKRNMKNNFPIVDPTIPFEWTTKRNNLGVDPLKVHWKLLGWTSDNLLQTDQYHRFFLSIGHARNSLAHQQILASGYIRDLVSNQWTPILQGYSKSYFDYPGHNLAFLFSDWVLLDSGHLLCRGINYETKPNSQFIVYKNEEYQLETSKQDLGFHVYPSPFVERPITLIYTEAES
jgi:hypothetical protein